MKKTNTKTYNLNDDGSVDLTLEGGTHRYKDEWSLLEESASLAMYSLISKVKTEKLKGDPEVLIDWHVSLLREEISHNQNYELLEELLECSHSDSEGEDFSETLPSDSEENLSDDPDFEIEKEEKS